MIDEQTRRRVDELLAGGAWVDFQRERDDISGLQFQIEGQKIATIQRDGSFFVSYFHDSFLQYETTWERHEVRSMRSAQSRTFQVLRKQGYELVLRQNATTVQVRVMHWSERGLSESLPDDHPSAYHAIAAGYGSRYTLRTAKTKVGRTWAIACFPDVRGKPFYGYFYAHGQHHRLEGAAINRVNGIEDMKRRLVEKLLEVAS
jgi:hypothetical protein